MLIQNISSASTQPVSFVGNGITSAASNSNTTAALANAPMQEPTSEQLSRAVSSLNNVMQQSNISLSFSVASGSSTPVVSVTDSATGQVVAQFPSKATLAIAQAIDQNAQRHGLLLSQTA